MLHSLINSARARIHNNSRAGFTLIELLVVIVLLGILMAIAVPTFQNAQQRGQASSAQSELRTAYQLAQGEYSYNADGLYPSTQDMEDKLNESEDEIQFDGMALTQPVLQDVEDAVIAYAGGNADALASDAFAGTLDPAVAGTVGVQVFDFDGAAPGSGTSDPGDDTVATSGSNPTALGTTTKGNAIILTRKDVSRNQVTWFVVSNRDEGLPDDVTGVFYGSNRDDFTWRPN